MTRTPLIAANWKMNHNVEESIKFVTRLRSDLILSDNVEVVIAPPFTSLYSVSIALGEKQHIKLSAQNCHWEDSGAFTGEISCSFLQDLQCQYVILGHSERRHIFGETDSDINKKVHKVFNSEMTPIFCIGETLDQREANQTLEVVTHQLNEGLKDVHEGHLKNVVIAYEPVWAIGTGKTATPEQAEEVHASIRNWLTERVGEETAQVIRVLYGGSVKPDNIAELMKKPNIDGALVGGASLEVESFLNIINY